MSRKKKYKEGTCPDCRGYGVTKKEIKKDITQFTCSDCGFMYTVTTPGARTDSDPDEKCPDSLF